MNQYITSFERLTIGQRILNIRTQIIKLRYDLFHKYNVMIKNEQEIIDLLAHADKLLNDAYKKLQEED